MRDMIAKGRANGYAKLTEALVNDIRQRVANGEAIVVVAQSLLVSKSCIERAVNRSTWRHIG